MSAINFKGRLSLGVMLHGIGQEGFSKKNAVWICTPENHERLIGVTDSLLERFKTRFKENADKLSVPDAPGKCRVEQNPDWSFAESQTYIRCFVKSTELGYIDLLMTETELEECLKDGILLPL